MTAKKKTEPVDETVEEQDPVEEPTVTVHDYDPVRPHSRRVNKPPAEGDE